jgi:hypothetical protein
MKKESLTTSFLKLMLGIVVTIFCITSLIVIELPTDLTERISTVLPYTIFAVLGIALIMNFFAYGAVRLIIEKMENVSSKK